jgi:hypothetical protein
MFALPKLVVHFGIQLLTMNQADWEETNRKASAFAALQQDEDEEDEDDDDDVMVKDSAPAKVAEGRNVFEMETEGANPITDNPASVDEADEIT